MEVVFYFFVAFFYLIFAGYGITKLLRVEGGPSLGGWLIPVIGFCLTLVVFSESMRFLGSAQLALIATLGVAAYFNVRYAQKVWKSGQPISVPLIRERISSFLLREEIWGVIIVAVVVVAACGWNFFVSGWGTYWGTASGDIFDALRGRDLLISNPDAFFTERMGYYDLDPLNWYQYSILSFWTTLFGTSSSMNVFYLELLLMLALLPGGIYLFCRESLGLSHVTSLASSAASSLSAFYAATYFSGHIGSIVFGTVAVYSLYLIVVIVQANRLTRDVVAFCLLLGWVVLFTYPYPMPFVLFPLAVALIAWKTDLGPWISRKLLEAGEIIKKSTRVAVVVGGTGVVLISGALIYFTGSLLWSYGESFRGHASQFVRAWYISQFKEIWLVYFGLVPSNLPFGLGGFIRGYSQFMITSAFLLVGIYVGVMVYGLWLLRKRNDFAKLFFLSNAAVWVVSYFFMRYFVGDPYYLYKFLYTTQFLWLILLTWTFEQLWQRSSVRFARLSKMLTLLISVIYVGTNLAVLLVIGEDVARRPYNRSELVDSAEIEQVRRFSASGLFFQYSRGNFTNDQGNILSYLLERNGIGLTKADSTFVYVLRTKTQNDIVLDDGVDSHSSQKGWEGRHVRIDSVRSTDLLLTVDSRFRNVADSWYAAERHNEVLTNTPFRWASYKLDLYLLHPSGKPKFLNFFVSPGPGLEYRPFLLYVYLNKNQVDTLVTPGPRPSRILSRVNDVLLDSVVVKGMSVVSIEIPKLPEPVYVIRMMNKALGRNLLPWEERFLNYQVANVSLTDEPYVSPALGLLNPRGDIIHDSETRLRPTSAPSEAPYARELMLWANWGPLESRNGKKFRWVNNDAQFLVMNPSGNNQLLELEIERGPALPTEKANFEVLLGDSVVYRLVLNDRHNIRVQFPHKIQLGSLITVRVDRSGEPLRDDPRIMNFRVFRAFLTEY